jgi:adenine-specific DNA-methyltransferase
MAMKTTKKKASVASADRVEAIKHDRATRKNIPPAGLEAQGRMPRAQPIRYEYNPHLPPVLRWSLDAPETDRLPELLRTARERPLTEDEARVLAAALRKHEPWLEWSGKREKPWFEVDPVVLHMHERVSTQAILKVLAREDVQRGLFGDPQQSYADAVQFYEHDIAWTNRMILGDSLQVMASLARREDLAGKLQMIYVDPPYGISFRSNFQPELKRREIKDQVEDLTREPEMVKAYRDTWTLGVHSYLAYLRDRLLMAKELLTDSGSLFLQISDENVHRVRGVLDEVFGCEHAIATIAYKKSAPETRTIKNGFNYLLWYAKDSSKVRTRKIFRPRRMGEGTTEDPKKLALWLRMPDGFERPLTTDEKREEVPLPVGAEVFRADKVRDTGKLPDRDFLFDFEGELLSPGPNHCWRGKPDEMRRLKLAERLLRTEQTLAYKLFTSDSGGVELTSLWEDTAGKIPDMIYVVQTNAKIVERCMLMTTDVGDIVLDPTCGSGTTAHVAEEWGRRWITIDTSRVALALARQRLMTARLPAYELRQVSPEDLERNPDGMWLTDPTGHVKGKATFRCKTVPHVMLKSIARNTSLDPVFAKHDSVLSGLLSKANVALGQMAAQVRQTLADKYRDKERREGKAQVTDADRRRWLLPKSEWHDWEVPFDTDPDWPPALQDAVTAYSAAWRAKINEVNAVIATNAESEELVNDPDVIGSVIRVAGPFTMEGVIALEQNPETPIGGAPDELETFDDADAHCGDVAVANAEAYLDKIIRLLKTSGVDFANNKRRIFARIEPVSGASFLHAEGDWTNGDGTQRRVAISIGPEVGNVSAGQVEEAIHSASRRGYDDLLIVGFGFDAVAQNIVEGDANPRVRSHMSLIRPDVAMDDLLKTQPGSQLFTVFSAPRVRPPERQPDGQYVVEVEGMDIYDPVNNTLHPTNKDKIAAWFLDSDYDGRTFCITQAFFPDKSKWTKLARALGDQGTIDESAFEALSGWRSLPFPRSSRLKSGDVWRVAVKVIDPRGNEGLRVVEIH